MRQREVQLVIGIGALYAKSEYGSPTSLNSDYILVVTHMLGNQTGAWRMYKFPDEITENSDFAKLSLNNR